jgi:hypothetical protein
MFIPRQCTGQLSNPECNLKQQNSKRNRLRELYQDQLYTSIPIDNRQNPKANIIKITTKRVRISCLVIIRSNESLNGI